MNTRLIVALIATVALSACATQQGSMLTKQGFVSTKAKNFGVTLDAKPQQQTVKVTSKAQGWNKSGKKDGYVGYARGESGLTLFMVKGEDVADRCSGSAAWVITRLRLASEGDPGEQKGSNFGSPQPAWLAEAFPGVDLGDGDLFNTDRDGGQTFLPVFNANQQEGEKTIYYEVTLTPCDENIPSFTTDPAWGNGGKR